PPTIKAGSSLGVRKEDDAPRSARGGADTADAPPSNGGGTAAAAAAISSGTQPTSDKIGRETPRSLSGMPPDERDKGPLASASSPTGGMILNAPGVVSKSVREREVKPPAPMRIGGFAGGGSGAIGRRGDNGTAAVGRGIMGGFPAVRHRSEMGLIKLGAGAASASSGAPAAAAVAVAKGNAASKRGGHGRTGGGGGKGGGHIPGDIHEENLSRISAMSPDEIADAQQEIRAALPPGALEMLLRRGRGGGGKAASGTPAPGAPTGAQRAATAAGGINSEEALEAALLTLPPEERAKSRWTLAAGVTTAAAGGPGDTGGRGGGDEARVDLDGAVVVVPAGDGGGGSARDGGEGLEALHHHGDDPDKAGYTPSELVRLARSTVSGQRQLALRALAGVLR
ncbi:unnamed protein product, partial [Ectocarpus fasciculatus]